MTKAAYWQRGESLDYVNTTSSVIEANTVVDLKTRIGIVGTDINPKETGSLHVTGIYEFQKASEEIEMGAAVYYDGTNISTTSTGTPAGYAAAKAETADETVLVKLLG